MSLPPRPLLASLCCFDIRPPLSSTPPSTAVPPAPSDPPNLPPSSNPVLDDIFPTDSHRSSAVTMTPRNPPRPTSAPHLDASTEDDGSPKPGCHKENDALDPPSVNHAIHANTTALDLLPQSSSLLLVAHSDVVFACPSLRLPDVERTGDHPPHYSRPHDIA
ncbi:hypothetical protein EDB83DRAFT_2405459 [Lactarius deliciosus]|nr:hypothetical protein EDB83DRAFT_2405459 [Lactarius deliciosus]